MNQATSEYQKAYEAAQRELQELLSQQDAIEKRIVIVRQSIQALKPLCETKGVVIDVSDELLRRSTLVPSP